MCSKKVKNREWQRPETTFSEKAGENGRKCVLWPHERVSCRDTRIDRNNHSSWITRLDKNVYRFNGLNSMQWVQHIYFALQSLITHNHTKSDFKLKRFILFGSRPINVESVRLSLRVFVNLSSSSFWRHFVSYSNKEKVKIVQKNNAFCCHIDLSSKVRVIIWSNFRNK